MSRHTEIAFILDRSGSMESIRQAAIDGFNEFLRDQQATPGDLRLTLVLFDDEILCIHRSMPVALVPPLTHDTFIPRGSTALLDAIGDTIDLMGKRFAKMPEAKRPGHVSVAILTDGEENSSQRFTWHDVAKRIQHQTEKYQWNFMFLGAGPDAIATAAKMNIAAHNAAVFANDSVGQVAATMTVSRKVRAWHKHSMGVADAADHADMQRNAGDVVFEEDQKRRGK